MDGSVIAARKDLIRLVLVIVFLKLILLLVPVFSSYCLPYAESTMRGNFYYPPDEPLSWKSSLKTWDANFFLYLADKGYQKGASGNQMLPLFPFCIAAVKHMTGWDILWTGLFLSNLFSLVAFVCLYLFAIPLMGQEKAFHAVVYALVFPTSFFFTRIYSESLFLLLALLCFLSMYKKAYIWVSFYSFLLALTRMVGVLIALPIAFFVWSQFRREAVDERPRAVSCFLMIAAPIFGLLFSMFLMSKLTGNWFEHFDAQKMIVSGHSFRSLLDLPGWFVSNFITVRFTWGGFLDSIFERIAFLFYLYFLWKTFRELDRPLFWYAFVFGMIPALSDHFMSYSRFLIVIFPLFMVMARLPMRHRRLQWIMFICQIVLVGMHSLGYWVA